MFDKRFFEIAAAAYAADANGATWRGAGAKKIVDALVDEESSIADRDEYRKSSLYKLAIERQRHLMPSLLKRAVEGAAHVDNKDFSEIEPSFGILSSMHMPRAIEPGKYGRCVAPQNFDYPTFIQSMQFLTSQGAAIAEGVREYKRILEQVGEYWKFNPTLTLPQVLAMQVAAE